MICGTIMILSALAGVLGLFSGAIGPGLGLLCVAALFCFFAAVEFEAADKKRDVKFLVAYEKLQREARLDRLYGA